MKTRYLVEVEMKLGYSPMTERRVESAVWDSGPKIGSIRNVSVKRGDVVDDVSLGNDLYAYGERRGMRWVMLDYFNTYKKAENARFRAKRNCLFEFKKDGDFATFQFNPNTSVWEKC